MTIINKSILFTIIIYSSASAQDVWYVDKANLSGVKDGKSWKTAYRTIQTALDAVGGFQGWSTPPNTEVWVAEGIYSEQRDNETGSLKVPHGVSLYGGFKGNESSREERDWQENETIIDGSHSLRGQPARHVVLMGDGELDGFTISGGECMGGDGESVGGGILASEGKICNCTFKNNSASRGGAVCFNGIHISSGGLIHDCTFIQNSAEEGGAIAFLSSETLINRCIFIENKSTSGGAVWTDSTSTLLVNASRFFNNSANDIGGGIMNMHDMIVANCIFWRNQAKTGAGIYTKSNLFTILWDDFGKSGEPRGGVVVQVAGKFTIANSTFVENKAGQGGTALCSTLDANPNISLESESKVYNCIFYANSPDQVSFNEKVPIDITFSDVQGGWVGKGNIKENPVFIDTTKGEFFLSPNSPCIDMGTESTEMSLSEELMLFIPESIFQQDIVTLPRKIGKAIDMGAYEIPIKEPKAAARLAAIYEAGMCGERQDYNKALKWYYESAEQGEEIAFNGLGWIHATCKDTRFLDGKRAVEFALKAVDNSGANYLYYDTLAAAYARDSQFVLAVQTQEKAIKILKDSTNLTEEERQKQIKDYESRLELFKNNIAYTDPK